MSKLQIMIFFLNVVFRYNTSMQDKDRFTPLNCNSRKPLAIAY